MHTITAQDLEQMQARGEKFALINTLSPEDFVTTKIPGSQNIPQDSDDFVKRVEAAAGGKDQPVVVYCASEQCHSSTKGGEKLEAAGFSNVTDFEGGAKEWKAAGQQLA